MWTWKVSVSWSIGKRAELCGGNLGKKGDEKIVPELLPGAGCSQHRHHADGAESGQPGAGDLLGD